jgi:hypothetical protein
LRLMVDRGSKSRPGEARDFAKTLRRQETNGETNGADQRCRVVDS